MRSRESFAIDLKPGFIHLVHERTKDNAQDIGGQIWFERTSLPWVLDTLRACLATYGFPETATQSGQDSLKIFESGPEQAPVVNLFNVRPKDATHGGTYARTTSRAAAQQLIDKLEALG